ncbi:MAG: leucyl aminopeptidase [Acidobacteriota bacterium]
MKLKLGGSDAASIKADVLVVTVFEGEAEAAGEIKPTVARDLRAILSKNAFSGEEGKVRSAPAPDGVEADRILFVGLGKRGVHPLSEQARRAGGVLLGRLAEHGVTNATVVPPDSDVEAAASMAEGLFLADYSFDTHKSDDGNGKKTPPTRNVTLALSDEARTGAKAEVAFRRAVARGNHVARDLGNEPSNVLTPVAMAKRAQAIAKEHAENGITCKVLTLADIKKKKMGAFLAVAQGSELEPRFIHLTYTPSAGKGRKGKTVGVVGKGLTFDSGGISIKPGAGMQDMKFDMCGSAAVLGLFECLPDLGIRHEVHGFIAACDNMPSGGAYKPGDIITSMSGRTIEIHNTDAEGRLTLVDAIHYALDIEPDVLVDLATLTGAAAMALGQATAVFTHHDELRDALMAAAAETGERAWPLPMFEDYKSHVKSDVADVKNLGERFAGATSAALFIDAWVPDELPWAHLDIAGSAWIHSDQAYCSTGATGTGVRTLASWLRQLGD